MRSLAIFALSAAFCSGALAFLPGPYVPVAAGNAVTFGAGTASAANTAGHAFSYASNGAVLLNGPVSFSPSSGVNVNANMVGSISRPNAAAALGRFAAKVIAPLGLGNALWDLAKELGFGAKNHPSGVGTEFTKRRDGFDIRYDFTTDGVNWFGDAGAACRAYASTRTVVSAGPYNEFIHGSADVAGRKCKGQVVIRNSADTSGNGPYAIETLDVRTKQIQTASEEPATYQDFVDAVAAKSGWPAGSALARATKDAVVAGEKLPIAPTTLTGPATTPGTSTTTDDGSKITTRTTTNNHTYAGPKVTTTVRTTTTTTDKATGQQVGPQVVETETPVLPQTQAPASTDPAAEKEPVITCGLPDTPPCKIDETGTPEPATEDVYKSKVDKTKADQDALRDKTGGTTDKPILDGWGALFITPPLAACVPYTLPRDMGAIDPCPVVDGVRAVMAFLWAITALWSGMRMVREVI